LVWVAATRWLSCRRRLSLLAAVGLFWVLRGSWQAWVSLARP